MTIVTIVTGVTSVSDTIGAELRRCGRRVAGGRDRVLKWEGHWATAAGAAAQNPPPDKILDKTIVLRVEGVEDLQQSSTKKKIL